MRCISIQSFLTVEAIKITVLFELIYDTNILATKVPYFITCVVTKQAWEDVNFYANKTNQAKLYIMFMAMVQRTKFIIYFNSKTTPKAKNNIKNQIKNLAENPLGIVVGVWQHEEASSIDANKAGRHKAQKWKSINQEHWKNTGHANVNRLVHY